MKGPMALRIGCFGYAGRIYPAAEVAKISYALKEGDCCVV